MLSVPAGLRLALLSALAGRGLTSTINYYADGQCEDFKFFSDGPNGYPDGECSLLGTQGNYSSFKVLELDRGCDVTLYGADTPQGICSPGGSLVADLGRCYNSSSWRFYSIDTCRRIPSPQSTSTPASSTVSTSSTLPPATSDAPPTTSATSQASMPGPGAESSSSKTNTGAIAGGVVGGVAGFALIAGALWFCLRRRQRAQAARDGPIELGGEQVLEMEGREVEKPAELAEARYPRYEAGSQQAPQEMSAVGENKEEGWYGRDRKPPV